MEKLTKGQAEAVLSKIRKERQRRFDENPARQFPWHAWQRWIIDECWRNWDFATHPVRVIMMVAANRSGKSACAKGLLGLIVRLQHPLCVQLTAQDPVTGQVRPISDTDPMRIWVIPPSLGKARQDWITPPDGLGIKRWLGDLYLDMRLTPDTVIYARPVGIPKETSDRWTKKEMEEKATAIYVMSQDQDLLKFESSIVHVAIFDEEPDDRAQVNSVLMRLATTNGILIFAFTPLKGLSWSFHRWWKPLVVQGKAKLGILKGTYSYISDEGGRNVVVAQWGMAANPLSQRYAIEVENDHEMSEAEKRSRLHGEYGFVEGALLPRLAGLDLEAPQSDHAVFVVDELPKDGQYYLVADPNKSFGAGLFCIDSDDNMFVIAEHLKLDWPDWKHAKAFEALEKKYARGVVIEKADPGGAGAHSINNLNSYGRAFTPVTKGEGSVATSIKKLRGRTFVNPMHTHPITGEKGAPKIFFYRPGLLQSKQMDDGRVVKSSALVEQLSAARQSANDKDAPDTPHKDDRNRLDLFDVTRYMALMAIPPAPRTPRGLPGGHKEGTLPLDSERGGSNPGYEQQGAFWTPSYSFDDRQGDEPDPYYDGRHH